MKLKDVVWIIQREIIDHPDKTKNKLHTFLSWDGAPDKAYTKFIKQSHYDALMLDTKELMEALEYYAHPDHYEEYPTLSPPGTRPPGVLTNGGYTARKAIEKFKEKRTKDKL